MKIWIQEDFKHAKQSILVYQLEQSLLLVAPEQLQGPYCCL